jgi:hypothetical protein
VLNLGGYDVLLTPFEPEEVFRVGSAAWLDWRRRLDSTAVPARRAQGAGASAERHYKAFAAASGF